MSFLDDLRNNEIYVADKKNLKKKVGLFYS